MPIQAITFDLWHVLYADDAARQQARRRQRVGDLLRYFSDRRIFLDAEQVENALSALENVVRVPGRDSLTGQEIGLQAAQLLIGKKLARQHCDELAELLSLAGLRHPPRPVPGVLDTLGILAQRCRLALIADTDLTLGREWAEILRLDGLSRLLTHCTFSDQVLSAKPQPRQFLYTLAMLKVRPDEAVHVSADEHRDLRPAKAVGMRTILLATNDVAESTTTADATIGGLGQLFGVLHRWEGAAG